MRSKARITGMRRVILPALGMIALGLGCGKTDPDPRLSGAPDKVVKVGFLMETYDMDRWARDERIFTKKANLLGAEVLRGIAEGDQERQNRQAEALLVHGAEALVVVPKEPSLAARIVKSAHANRTPVLAYERLIRHCDLDLCVTYDQKRVGYLQAKGLLEKVPEGNYILLGGPASDHDAKILRKGQLKAIDEHEKATGRTITILADPYLENWDGKEAHRRISSLLTTLKTDGKKVDAIVASNDLIAGGAVAALTMAQLHGQVAVSGADAELAACQRIVAGTQTVTVYKPIRPLAECSAQAAVRLARHEKPETILQALGHEVHLLDNGFKQVPSLVLEPVSVTRENMVETVIRDGWQSMENVYAHVPRNQWPR